MNDARIRLHHIGSFLRPQRLREARRLAREGRLDPQSLRAVEDECIRDILRLQERFGFPLVTDGEFRRASWRSVIVERVPGFATGPAVGELDLAQDATGHKIAIGSAPMAVAPIDTASPITADDALFVMQGTDRAVKVTLPSPSYLHFLRGDASFDRSAYETRDAYFNDLVRLYTGEVRRLAGIGVRMVQFDEVAATAMCDPAIRRKLSCRGDDPMQLLARYREVLQSIIEAAPDALRIGIHMCRGNYLGKWLASGGYEPLVGEYMSRLFPDYWLLEFDSARSGGFDVLRALGRDGMIVLGLISTKSGVLEERSQVLARIAAAARVAPLENLGISPQCGFASHERGNPLTQEEQEGKLRLLADIAETVWGRFPGPQAREAASLARTSCAEQSP